MSKVAHNISHLRKVKGITQEQMADHLGIKKSRLGSYEEGRSDPPIDVLIQLSSFFRLPIDALVRYDLCKAGDKSFIDIGRHRVLFPIMIDQDNEDTIEVVSVKASAGYLNGYADPEFIENLQLMKLPFLPTGKHRAFPIKGDSMPPLSNGSFVIGKFLEDIRQVKDGNTYVLLTRNDGIVYKRVYNHIKQSKALMLSSDNKNYDPYHVPIFDVLEIWEYVCSINTGTYQEDDLNMGSIMNMLRQMQVELKEIKRGKDS
ncbi:MAG TPA: LexA family transcriptional regulator [Flavobacteriales bacterium]|nr:LexA family transcriptional regulator [Flavobacteriales bacterium]